MDLKMRLGLFVLAAAVAASAYAADLGGVPAGASAPEPFPIIPVKADL